VGLRTMTFSFSLLMGTSFDPFEIDFFLSHPQNTQAQPLFLPPKVGFARNTTLVGFPFPGESFISLEEMTPFHIL